MFNRRKRSYRKGPPANQIYVPHDQRNINQDPIPITTEKQAQYYYKQLYDMGYITEPVEPDYQVFQIVTSDDTFGINFTIFEDQTVHWYGNLPDNLAVYDINNQPIDPQYYDQINTKLSLDGYNLYVVRLLQGPRLVNHATSGYIPIQGLYNGDSSTVYTYQLNAGQNTGFNYITTCLVSRTSDNYYMIDSDPGMDSSGHVGCVKVLGNIGNMHFSVKAMVLVAVKT